MTSSATNSASAAAIQICHRLRATKRHSPAVKICSSFASTRPPVAMASAASRSGSFKNSERYESNLTAIDPLTGEVKKNAHLRYPNAHCQLVADLSLSACWTEPSQRWTTARLSNFGKSTSAQDSPRRR
jgi:hypothetical protein